LYIHQPKNQFGSAGGRFTTQFVFLGGSAVFVLVGENRTMQRWLILTLTCLGTAYGAELGEIKTVYLLPMSRGLDQFLAERLTSQQVLQVVTDPKKADAIFTDRVGANFEQSIEELYDAKKEEVKSSDKVEDLVTYQRPAMQPLSRGKGNIFLVDRESKSVLWSTFVEPKTSNSKDMNQIADQVSDKLAKARKKK
jgi:hypothetical protein